MAPIVNPDGQRSNLFTFSVSSHAADSSFVLPQFAFGGGWSTSLHFSNTAGSPLTVQVDFLADNGTSLSVPLVGAGTVSSQTIAINPGATAIVEALKAKSAANSAKIANKHGVIRG